MTSAQYFAKKIFYGLSSNYANAIG